MRTIRRSVYIGLGEVGVNAILQTKKMYEDEFGEGNIPEQIQFVPIASYDFRGRWWPFSDMGELELEVERDGRRFDYMLFERNWHPTWDAVSNAVSKAVSCGDVDVHVVCALGGGLGSGAFLPLAVMLSQDFSKDLINLYGYGLRCKLRDIPIEKQRLCEHAALLELDYYQSVSSSDPIEFTFDRRPFKVYEPLFARYYLIDEQTELGMIVDSKSLTQAVAMALYFQGTEDGYEVSQTLSSVDWKKGNYDCYNKKGWVHRLGVEEVVYDGDAMARRYSLLVKAGLLSQLNAGNEDVAIEAQHWTDSIIERIHSLIAPSVSGEVMIDPSHTYEVVRLFVKKYLEDPEDSPPVRREAICSLRDKVESLCNNIGYCGAKNFLVALQGMVCMIKDESSALVDANKSALLVSSAELEFELEDYGKYLKRIFKSRTAKLEYIHCIAQKAKQTLGYRIGLMRQETIAETFASLNSEICSLLGKVEAMLADVALLREECREALDLTADRIALFRYDLSYKEEITLEVDPSDVSLKNFATSQVVPLAEMTKLELNQALDAYVLSLPRCEEYRSKQLEDVIVGMSSQEYEHFKKEIRMRSAALLPIDARATSLAEKMNQFLFVSMHKSDVTLKSRLEDDQHLMPHSINCHFISSCNPGMKQRMLLLRVDAAIIPYAVESKGAGEIYDAFLYADEHNPHVENFYKIICSGERVEQAKAASVAVQIIDDLLKMSDITQRTVRDWVHDVDLLRLPDEDAAREIRNVCADYLRRVAGVSNLIFFLGELMIVCSGHAALVNEITEQQVKITALRETLWSVRLKSLNILRGQMEKISRHKYILPGVSGFVPVEIDFSGFISTLKASIGDMSETEICSAVKQYAVTLPYAKKHILEMLENLPDEASFDRPLCDSYWLILTYSDDPHKKLRFKNHEQSSSVRYLYTNRVEMKDAVAIYQCRRDFLPSDADRVIEYLLNNHNNPHIDLQICEEMKKRDFNLKPRL